MYDRILSAVSDLGYRTFETGHFNLNIIGERSETSKSNSFDDKMHLIYKNESGKMVHKVYPITTDPGKHWLKNPMVKEGTAILVPFQYGGAFAIGIHGRSWASGGYEALEQVRPMFYVRDNNKDEVVDFSLYRGKTLESFQYMNAKTNIHRAAINSVVRYVERHSAGCQVFQNPSDFKEFMGICKIASRKYGNSFTYTLIEERDIK